MIRLATAIVIMDNGTVVLTRREDFEVWCLPSGEVDDGESPGEAAVREAYEETGLDVRLTRLVGLYMRPRRGDGIGLLLVVFAAEPVGGRLQPDPGEVVDIGRFTPDDLPEPLLWTHRQPIADAVSGAGGSVVWEQPSAGLFDSAMSREELYAMRDRSGLSRSEFYLRLMGPADGAESREV